MKKFTPLILGVFVTWFGYTVLATGMYTYKLAEFYGLDYEFTIHGLAPNGNAGWGNKIDVTDLATTTSAAGGGSIEERCPDVKSKRGFVTMGFVGEGIDSKSVCCSVANINQRLVPFKDVDKERHYLCGEWPHLDYVIQPLANRKLNTK